MSPVKVAKFSQQPAAATLSQGPKVTSTLISEPDAADDLQVLSLDQLEVIEGVYRKERINSSSALVVGDEFQFPEKEDQFRTSCHAKAGRTSVEVFIDCKFGPTSFSATVTHTVIFLSETGKQLSGYVLDGSRNAADRPSVILGGEVISASNYTLIDISVGHKELEWSTAASAPLSGQNATLRTQLHQ